MAVDLPPMNERGHLPPFVEIREGNIPISALSPADRDGIGGTSFSDQGTDEMPCVFSNKKMREVW